MALPAITTWTGGTNANWNNAGNWDALPTSNLTATDILFNATSTANLATTNDFGTFSIRTLTVVDPTGPVSIAGSGTLSIGTGGIDLSTATQNLTITQALATGGTQAWNIGTGRTLLISSSVNFANQVTLSGAGITTLSGSNSGAGGVRLGSGATLNINNTAALGTSSLTLTGSAIIDNTTASAITANNALILSGGSLTFTGTRNLTLGATTISGANRTFTITANTLTLGNIDDAGGTRALTKDGNGTLTMSGAGANTYTGATTVNHGILILNKTAGTTAIAGNLTLTNTTANSNNAQITFQASDQIADTATVTLNAVSGQGISRFEMGNFSETIAALVISNTQGTSVFNAINNTFGAGTGTLTVNGPITIGGTSSAATTLGNVKLDLGGVTRTITVTGTSPTTISSVIQNAGITKTGSALSLTGANTYTGPTSVTTGILRVGVVSGVGNGALGNNSDVTLANTAGVSLDLTNNTTGNFSTQIGSLTGGGLTGGNITLGSATLTIAGSTSPAAFGGVISGTGNLIRSGSGSTILAGNNLYSGGTSVTSGTLFANNTAGSATGTGIVTVSGGTLGGSGIISGATTIASGGTLAPGNSIIDSLTITNTLGLSGLAQYEINDQTSSADVTDGITTLTFGGTLNVTNLGNSSGYSNGQLFNLFDYNTSIGSFSTITLPSLPGGLAWKDFGGQPFDYTNGTIQVTAIPEPGTLLYAALGIAASWGFRRRQRVNA